METITCEYCEKDKVMLSQDYIALSCWGWGGPDFKISAVEAESDQDTYSLFIDRGYLRLVDRYDSQCLDHGAKIKINFCPICGKDLKQKDN